MSQRYPPRCCRPGIRSGSTPAHGHRLPRLLLRQPPRCPGLDHTAQLRDLRRALAGAATVRVTDCLDACERANVIVVQTVHGRGRKAGGRPVWLGLVNDPDATADITAWIEGGGPGLTEPPGILDLYAFKPSRRVRPELHDE